MSSVEQAAEWSRTLRTVAGDADSLRGCLAAGILHSCHRESWRQVVEGRSENGLDECDKAAFLAADEALTKLPTTIHEEMKRLSHVAYGAQAGFGLPRDVELRIWASMSVDVVAVLEDTFNDSMLADPDSWTVPLVSVGKYKVPEFLVSLDDLLGDPEQLLRVGPVAIPLGDLFGEAATNIASEAVRGIRDLVGVSAVHGSEELLRQLCVGGLNGREHFALPWWVQGVECVVTKRGTHHMDALLRRAPAELDSHHATNYLAHGLDVELKKARKRWLSS